MRFSSFQENTALIDVFPLVVLILIVKSLSVTLVTVPLSPPPTTTIITTKGHVPFPRVPMHAMRLSVHCTRTFYSTVYCNYKLK